VGEVGDAMEACARKRSAARPGGPARFVRALAGPSPPQRRAGPLLAPSEQLRVDAPHLTCILLYGTRATFCRARL
jgi:hypothetical protein